MVFSTYYRTFFEYFAEIKKFSKFLRPYRRLGLWAGFWMTLAALLQLPMPMLSVYLIDTILPQKNITLLSKLCAALIIVLLTRSTALFIQRLCLVRYRAKVTFDIRRALFEHIQLLPISFLENYSSGYMVSRLDGDVNHIQGLLAETFLQLLRESITFFTGCVLLFYFHPLMAGLCLLFLPFFVITFHYFGQKMREINMLDREKWAQYTGVLEEGISNIPLTKAFNRYKTAALKLVGFLKHAAKIDARAEITGSLSGIVTGIIGGLAPLVILWIGISEIINGHLTLGQFFAFNSLMAYLYAPINNIIDLNIQIQGCLASSERIFQILDQKTECFEGGITLAKNSFGDIEFQDVGLQFDNCREQVLRNLSFNISCGAKTTIVGLSGSGKSTIAKLIMRYYQPQSGVIRVNGTDIRQYELCGFRRRIGYASQNTLLFSGTIKENLLFGDPTATDARLEEALDIAGVLDFVRSLPQGMLARIGQDGIGFSGGENQRIALARCVLKDPELFVLDEVTAAIDVVHESLILQNLFEHFPRKTFLVITHRLDTVKGFDQIVVLRNGEVVEVGTHEELTHNCAHYYDICKKDHEALQNSIA